MPAQVLRVWVNTYEDANGNLVHPSRVFTEVTPRKWNVGYSAEKALQSSRRITPLVAPEPEPEEREEEASKTTDPHDGAGDTPMPPVPDAGTGNEAIPNSLPPGTLPPLK